MNKNIINRRRLSLSRISNQYPWNLAKLRRSLKNRKWFRRKFSPDIAPGKIYFKKKKMKTYETRVKMLFRRLYAPGVNATQFKKLFKFKNRYRSTFRTIASLEHQFDTLVFRLYLLKNITLAQYCISNNFFLLNGESKLCWKSIVRPGNFIEVNSSKIWNIFYIHILSSMASLKKYYNRLFFKICYPFVGKKKYRIFKEEKWKKKKSVRFLKKRLFHRKKVFYNRKQQKIFKKWFFFKPVVRRPLIMLRRERWFRQIKRLSKNGVLKWKKALKYFKKLKKKKTTKKGTKLYVKTPFKQV